MSKAIWISIIVAILVVGGLVYYMNSENSSSDLGSTSGSSSGTSGNSQDASNVDTTTDTSSGSSTDTKPSTQPAPTGTTHKVNIQSFAFSPSTLTINVGDSITWTNKDSSAHTATSADGNFNSDRLEQGESFTFKFTSKGSFAYICDIHPSMKGTIVVQ